MESFSGMTSGFGAGSSDSYGTSQGAGGFGTNSTLFGDKSYLNQSGMGPKRAK